MEWLEVLEFMKAYYNVTTLMKTLGKSRQTIIRYIQQGKFGKVHQINGQYQIPREGYQKFWNEHVKVIDGSNVKS